MSLSIGQCLLFTLNQYYYINSYDNNKHQIVHGILFFYIYLIVSIDMLLFILHFIDWQIYIKSNRRLTLLVLLLLYWDHPFFCLYLFSFFLVFGSSLLCFVFALLFFVFRASLCFLFVLFLYSNHPIVFCWYCCFCIRVTSFLNVCIVVFLFGSSLCSLFVLLLFFYLDRLTFFLFGTSPWYELWSTCILWIQLWIPVVTFLH